MWEELHTRSEALRQKDLEQAEKSRLPTATTSLDRGALNRDALVFIPRGLSGGAGVAPRSLASGGAATCKPTQILPPYDGRSPWDAYHTQLEMLARMNGWSKKATYLTVSLKGPALTVLSNLHAYR